MIKNFSFYKKQLELNNPDVKNRYVAEFNEYNGGKNFDFNTFKKFYRQLEEKGIETKKIDLYRKNLKSAFWHTYQKAIDKQMSSMNTHFLTQLEFTFLPHKYRVQKELKAKRKNRIMKSMELFFFITTLIFLYYALKSSGVRKFAIHYGGYMTMLSLMLLATTTLPKMIIQKQFLLKVIKPRILLVINTILGITCIIIGIFM
jgi:hypothetical protein